MFKYLKTFKTNFFQKKISAKSRYLAEILTFFISNKIIEIF